MAITIQTKRSTGTTAPGSLAAGELAVTYGTGSQANNGERLFIGNNDASSVLVIGGKYFSDKLDHVEGTLTASSALITDTNSSVDKIQIGNAAAAGGILELREGTNNGSNYLQIAAPAAVTANTTFTLPDGAGSNGQYLQTNGSGTLSWNTVVSSYTLAGDTGSDSINTGNTITFVGGEGIDTTSAASSDDTNITIAAEVATDSNKGVATFNTADFDVTSGDVTIKALGVSNGQLAGSIANAKLSNSSWTISDGSNSTAIALGGTFTVNGTANEVEVAESSGTVTVGLPAAVSGLTSVAATTGTFTNVGGTLSTAAQTNVTSLGTLTAVAVDNVTIDGNTISTTDTNGDLILAPHGSGDIDAGNSKIINVTDPTADQHAATKAYVDATVNGLHVKDAVFYATTANLASTYNNGSSGVGATLTASSTGVWAPDGTNVTAAERILVKNQTDASENGIYTVTTAGAVGVALVLTRTADANQPAELDGGTFVFVEHGSTQAENGYVFTHNGQPTFGSTDLPVSQFSGAGQITAGTGLTKSGNTINAVAGDGIDTAADEITVDLKSNGGLVIESTEIAVDLAASSITGTLAIGDGGTGATTAAAAASALGVGTEDSPQFTGIELGHASDTTITRSSGGVLAVEGNVIYHAGGTDVAVTDGGTGLSAFAKGSVVIANAVNTLSALDGGGSNDGTLLYTASSDTISWATAVDGGTF